MDIVFLSAVDWHQPVKLPVHHVVNELSKRNRVIYVDNWGGSRWPKLRDWERITKRLQNSATDHPVQTAANISSGLWFVYPIIIPSLQWSFVLRFNQSLLLKQINRRLKSLDFKNFIVWSRVPTDLGLSIAQNLNGSCLVYQSTEKYSEAPTVPNQFRSKYIAADKAWCNNADLIFASAHGLFEEKKLVNPNTYFFPNGVRETFFTPPGPVPEAVRNISPPIVGFIGNIGSWVDIELLAHAAYANPDANFVLLGPAHVNVDLLEQLPNVHLMGPVSGELLPNYLHTFDVGLIPYRVTDFTRYTFPSKLMEYLAMGIPVVSTDLPELGFFNDHVMVSQDMTDFANKIQLALAQDDNMPEITKRKSLARKYEWRSLVSEMEATIISTLNHKKESL